ncbi:PREDICTED: sarcoplasmic calcium-binding proteins II, V, VI, and VII-like [Priapulus caudatus]|uniref:Sarcoplasmic calcium-binding proteins II, V, VI, and VII-like n=1 Tax=Priapulus caudatus TaxID=37621 RepID=A0ABM1EAZ1_PRICU|nr:PREDICTED: sarcoplasmic calcium-binding proteins II, V, VI, and VII-like [Priapulus caudatus]
MGIVRKILPPKDASEDAIKPLFELSDFQRRKLSYYFSLLDVNGDNKLTSDDITKFTEKMLVHSDVSEDAELYEVAHDVNRNFYESLSEKAGTTDVSCDQWLDIWAVMMRKCMSVAHFPYWVQLHCKIFFEIIDVDRNGEISKNELRHYYRNFIKIEDEYVEEQTEKGFTAMTANGTYPLNQELYYQNFANFILGKEIYGPGEYIFGVFDINRPKIPFRIILPVETEEEETALASLDAAKEAPLPSGRRISVTRSGKIAVADPTAPPGGAADKVRRVSQTKIPHVPRKRVVIRGLEH